MAQRWHHNHYDRMKQKTDPQTTTNLLRLRFPTLDNFTSSSRSDLPKLPLIKTTTIHYLHRYLKKHMLWEYYVIWDMSFYLIRSKSKLRYVTHGMFLRIIVTKFSWKKNIRFHLDKDSSILLKWVIAENIHTLPWAAS